MSRVTTLQPMQDKQTLAAPGVGKVGGAPVTRFIESVREAEFWITIFAIAAGVTVKFILETSVDGDIWAEAGSIELLTAMVTAPPQGFSFGIARANGDALGKYARLRYELAGGTVEVSVGMLTGE
jgi:hypothetical protein